MESVDWSICMKKFTAISLFCGAGGLDMGFDRAGFKTIWANDFDKDACSTYSQWNDATVVCGDIAKTLLLKHFLNAGMMFIISC